MNLLNNLIDLKKIWPIFLCLTFLKRKYFILLDWKIDAINHKYVTNIKKFYNLRFEEKKSKNYCLFSSYYLCDNYKKDGGQKSIYKNIKY